MTEVPSYPLYERPCFLSYSIDNHSCSSSSTSDSSTESSSQSDSSSSSSTLSASSSSTEDLPAIFPSNVDKHHNNTNNSSNSNNPNNTNNRPNKRPRPPGDVSGLPKKRREVVVVKKKPGKMPIQPAIPTHRVNLEGEIKTLDDLINLSEQLDPQPDEEYAFSARKVKNLLIPLKKLQELIGMKSVKQKIVDNLLYLLSRMNTNNDMKHTVIYGPPGCGKTTLAMILTEIYQAIGYSNGKLRTIKRSDLIGGYMGHTAILTQAIIDKSLGGVLFIDEAYSLGDKENRDSFAKEMIDCLTQNLSEKKGKFICIIAGYKKELDHCFFAVNPGLRRRFPFHYEIQPYTDEELRDIFLLKLDQQGMRLDDEFNPDDVIDIFKEYHWSLGDQGGDIENIVQMCKITHSNRIFGRFDVNVGAITREDFEKALEEFLSHKQAQQVEARRPDKERIG